MKNIIATSLAPKAIGPYVQATEVGGFIFCSGQIPLDPQTGELVQGDIQAQTHRVMKNIQAVLAEAGVGLDCVTKTTCFLTDMNDFAAFNEVYAQYFPENPPARSCVAVQALPKQAQVEVEVIAASPAGAAQYLCS